MCLKKTTGWTCRISLYGSDYYRKPRAHSLNVVFIRTKKRRKKKISFCFNYSNCAHLYLLLSRLPPRQKYNLVFVFPFTGVKLRPHCVSLFIRPALSRMMKTSTHAQPRRGYFISYLKTSPLSFHLSFLTLTNETASKR